jgi:hypothetical protein
MHRILPLAALVVALATGCSPDRSGDTSTDVGHIDVTNGDRDASVDSGVGDVGTDAGPVDAGSDAGPADSGTDAGMDAGVCPGSADCPCRAKTDCMGTDTTAKWACTPSHLCVRICTANEDCPPSAPSCEDLICRPMACADDSECASGMQCVGGRCQ